MGLPIIQAPSEGEAQAAYIAARGDVELVVSQDYDLLFGAPRVVRNSAITGKPKLSGKNIYVDVEPEIIHLEEGLARLGINRRQLVGDRDHVRHRLQRRPYRVGQDGPKADSSERGF